MGIGAQNHAAALRHHLSGVLMNHGLMGRHIDPAVLLCTAESKHMVVFVDGASHGAERIVAVGQYIGHGKSLQPRSPGRLYDPHKGNIMTGELIEPDFQLVHISGGIVALQNAVGDGLSRRLLFHDGLSRLLQNGLRRIRSVGYDFPAVHQIYAAL